MLGVTSTNGWARRLGRWWKRLHRAIYVLGAIALLHYFIQSKSNVSEPVFFSGLFVWLLLWRALPMAWQRSLFALLVLAVRGGVSQRPASSSPGMRLATGIDPWRVLAASETLRFGLRPAHYVALADWRWWCWQGCGASRGCRGCGRGWRPEVRSIRSAVSHDDVASRVALRARLASRRGD